MIIDSKIQYLAPETDVLELKTECLFPTSGDPSFSGFNDEVEW